MKSILKVYLLSLVVVLFCVAAVVHFGGVNFSDFMQALKRFRSEALLLPIVFTLLQVSFQIALLWALLPPQSPLGILAVARVFSFGQLLNAFVPAKAGEAYKAVALVRSDATRRLTLATCGGVLIAEKLLSIVTLLVLGILFGLSALRSLEAPPLKVALILGGGVLALFIVAVGLRTFAPSVFAKVKQFAREAVRGFSFIKSPTRLTLSTLFGFGAWVSEMLALLTLCHAAGASLSFAQALCVIFILNVGIAVPVSVANVGTFEASMAFGLHQFQVDPALGLAIATVHHLFQVGGLAVAAVALLMTGRVPKVEPQPAPSQK